MKVRDILRVKGSTLYTVSPDETLARAVETMAQFDIGSLAVMEHGELVGMLTFREVLQGVKRAGSDWQALAIDDVMIRNPQVASPSMEMDELRRMMVEHHQRYLPVMDGRTLLGVVSFHDVAKAVLEEQSFENRMLKNYIRNWPAQEEEGR